jgi:hypothetical protein
MDRKKNLDMFNLETKRKISHGIRISGFKVCKSVHHHTIEINHPTRRNNFSILLLDVYLQLNMFQASSRPSSGAQQLQLQTLVLPSGRGDSSAVGSDRAGGSKEKNQRLLLQLLSS